MASGLLVDDDDGSDRIADEEPSSAGCTSSCVASWEGRLLTDACEVIVTTAFLIPVHLDHLLSPAPARAADAV